ncbi:MAG: carboxypeptidase-like regulatory domain-containing protein, partial [Bacteroidales bacterium]|nr:carboxypeptidase-like regulatory domain-containing protein [Bacteroidales bacterium]
MNVRMKKLAALLAFVMCCTVAFAQNSVTGTVKDNTGETVIGATVQIKGGSTGVITDIDGKYTISGVLPSDVLVFSFLGFTYGDGFNAPATESTVLKVVAYGYNANDELVGETELT